MANISWPVGLPTKPEKTFSENIGLNIIRTPMDQGPAKVRYRSNRPQILNVEYVLTVAQVATLETFMYTTTKGVKRFNFLHPRTNQTVEVRVVSQQSGDLFTAKYLTPNYYRVSLQLEILP